MAEDSGLAAFERAIDKAQAKIIEKHREAHAMLVGATFGILVERSPVRTGAYRASHTIMSGEDEPREFIFEAPNRPEPDQEVDPGFGFVFAPPHVGGATEAARQQIAPASNVFLRNQRFYAGFLEYGTSQMEPRLIYESASQAAAVLAEQIAAAVTFDEDR